MLNLELLKLQYVTDETGEKKAVILPIQIFQQLIGDIQRIMAGQSSGLTLLPNTLSPDTLQKSSGLCGIWKDERPVEMIVDEVISSRTIGREVNL